MDEKSAVFKVDVEYNGEVVTGVDVLITKDEGSWSVTFRRHDEDGRVESFSLKEAMFLGGFVGVVKAVETLLHEW